MDYEKLGAFYLGRRFDTDTGDTVAETVLYDSKDLTTHGLIVGMTGSGKTGLSVGILEEAAIDGIPALVIDPKGDMANLMLTFPKLRTEDFEPWIDPAEANRRGQSVTEYAASTAELWREGLESWDQKADRVAKFKNAADVAVYTPGSNAGLPLSVLRSFAAPGEETRRDPDAMRERVEASVSGLLSLLGLDADPIQSREHILLSNLLDRAWREGKDLDLASLIAQVQEPPFDKLGVIDLETFLPAKARAGLAMQINNLLASTGFSAWMDGDPLDIQSLLYTPEGRPRISILSISHLSDAERMFVVTLVLNEMVAWMRSQSGTSSLRALLYMDEIFGFFPPSANPPSKPPMLTLLKQARAFGLGVLLATQNPVDLDYKGLSNCGTWFIGRLQTERDKERVLQGLEGASTQAGQAVDRRSLSDAIGNLGKRVFLMKNVHEDEPCLFQTRWVLSYLRGPLVREEIQRLMAPRKALLVKQIDQEAKQQASSLEAIDRAAPVPASGAGQSEGADADSQSGKRPALPADVAQRFLLMSGDIDDGAELVYRPMVYGSAQLHFKRLSAGVDDWAEAVVVAPIVQGARSLGWQDAQTLQETPQLRKRPEGGARFAEVPGVAGRVKAYAACEKKLSSLLYRTQSTTVYKQADLKQYSSFGESERDFRLRMVQELSEERDTAVEKLRAKYATRFTSLESKILTAEQRVEKEKSQLSDSRMRTAVSFGGAVMGAILGRKKLSVTNMRRAGSALRNFGRGSKEKEDIGMAEEKLDVLLEQKKELEAQFQKEVDELTRQVAPGEIELEAIEIRPLKTDITVQELCLLWTPWQIDSDGIAAPLFEAGMPIEA